MEVKIRARDRQYSSFLLILWTKVTKILRWWTWMYHVMHNTCTMLGRDIKTRFFGSTSILLLRKDQQSIELDRMLSSFKKHFQLILFRKLLEWKLEKSYTKKSSCHLDLRQSSHWNTNGRENGIQNMLNDQKSGSYLKVSNRPTNSKIQFVGDRGDLISRMTWLVCKMEEKRPVLRRSMLILVAKNLVLQSERCDLLRAIPGKPVHETSVIQTRSSEDRKDFNVEQTHERMERPVITHDLINVSDSSQTRSAHESDTFNVEDEVLRKKKERSVADHDVSHESMMVTEADMDFRIPGLPHSVVKYAQSTSVRELIQKIEKRPDRHALQQDLRQNQSFNLFSPESKQRFRMLVITNYVNCSKRNPKRSAQCVWHTGISVYSSTARAGISCIKKEGPIKNSSIIRWTFFQSLSMSSRREDLIDIDMVKSRETKEYDTANQLKKKCKKERFPRNPWPIHTRSRIPYSNDWKSSRRRSLSTMGSSCGWRSHSPFDRTIIPPL